MAMEDVVDMETWAAAVVAGELHVVEDTILGQVTAVKVYQILFLLIFL